MKTTHPTVRSLVLAGLCAALTAGCAGTANRQVAQLHRPFVAADYEQIYVTGSHIPILVPKDPSIRRVPTISPMVVLSVSDVPLGSGLVGLPMH